MLSVDYVDGRGVDGRRTTGTPLLTTSAVGALDLDDDVCGQPGAASR
jgi:hypothetical protein